MAAEIAGFVVGAATYRQGMPTTGTLLAFTMAALALIMLPGPGMLLLLARGIGAGRRPAIFSALGLETGSAVYVAATAAGLSAVLASSALAFSTVRYVGAAYLVVLGSGLFLVARRWRRAPSD